MEDFTFSHGTDTPDANGNQARIFKIGGLKSTDGREVEIVVNHLYISGTGSNYGQNLSPVNIGRLVNPYRIDVVDGNSIGIRDKAVLEFAAPALVGAAQGYDCMGSGAIAGSGICSSRPATADFVGERPDIGLQMNVAVGEDRSANINIHAKSAVIDGSYLRLWGDEDRRQMVGQFKLNFPNTGIVDQCLFSGWGVLRFKDHYDQFCAWNWRSATSYSRYFSTLMAPAILWWKSRPSSRRRRARLANDGLRGSSDEQTWDFYEDYYTNPDYRSNLHIGNFSVGDRDFGSARVEGMLIQHLDIRTKDLAP